ncbi:MAG TPA: HEAT repeat domain-containing protein [Candidatus Ozemobacteraceae bacterium]
MPNTAPAPIDHWIPLALRLLKDGSDADQQAVLETIGHHSALTPDQAETLLPAVTDLLLDPAPQVRYFARKARNQLEPLITPRASPTDPIPEQAPGAISLSRRDILLHKMRLGSRYVAFDAIERLTETADPTLAQPLLACLHSETDPFRLSYLVKRLPRIPSPDIVTAIEHFLAHPDPRVVANALEGLSHCQVPHLRDRFVELSSSPDNRVRAAAIQALHNYDPLVAERRLQEMLEHPSIAMQDSGVYLLGLLRPPRLNTLVEIPLASKYPTIRLRAVEIPRSPTGFDLSDENQLPGSPLTELHARKGLFTSLAASSGLMLASSFLTTGQTLLLLTAGGSALVATARNRLSSFLRAVISAVLAACLMWGESHLIVIPTLLAIWHPVQKSSDDRLARIAAWAFALASCLIAGLTAGPYPQLVQTALELGSSITGPLGDLRSVGAQLARFESVLFALIAGWSCVLLHVDTLFAASASAAGRKRRLLLLLFIGLAVIAAVNIGMSWSLRINLAALGITDPAQLFLRGPK